MATWDQVGRRRPVVLPPRIFFALRRLSPWVMLLGMSAWGVLLMLLTPVLGVSHPQEVWGIELPIALAAIGLWLIVTLLLLCARPGSVLAHQDDPDRSRIVIVRGPGDRWRVLFAFSAPVCGLLGVALLGSVAETIDSFVRDEPLPLWKIAAYGGMLLVGATAIIPAMRVFLHGIELMPERVVAGGYFRTRAFDRADIRKVRITDVPWWSSLMFTAVKMDVLNTLAIVRTDGTQVILPASNCRFEDLHPARDVIQAWIDRSGSR
ncbi:PH domain-containing protein [Microbacterium azadirachtae]|uniref:PH domain-containing protein n=1 Tax=Microbacterium azadirachtae TaxID=582680 RepID=A0A0F0LH64_9MICO|nr:PH domain-containing protein [Microbacterium azadirachtae]KJL32572.1 hypothetical protein RS86_02350 [Microbacterium azadirachtae]